MLTYLMCIAGFALGYFLGHANGYNKGAKDEYLGKIKEDEHTRNVRKEG